MNDKRKHVEPSLSSLHSLPATHDGHHSESLTIAHSFQHRQGSENKREGIQGQNDYPPSDNEIELTEADIWEKEKQELEMKVTELEEYRARYEAEKKETQMLQNRLKELMVGQSDTAQNLVRTNDALDRLRLDQTKKVEQIEKMLRDIAYKDDRIRNLEIRACDVEKAEIKLETTKQTLESTLQQVKVREAEIRRLEKDVDDYHRQLETAKTSIKDLEEKVEDMKIQIRHELMKNENIEKNLETIPRLKDTIEEKDAEIREKNKHIDEKNALLTAARKAVREYKDRLRYTEQEIAKIEELKEDLELSQSEVISLKRLMYGKDYLVSQKSKALDLTKEIISVISDSIENEQMERIQKLIEKFNKTEEKPLHDSSSGTDSGSPSDPIDIRSLSTPLTKQKRSTPVTAHYPRGIDVNTRPFTADTDHKTNANGILSKRCQNQLTVDFTDKQRPASAMPQPVKYKSSASIHRTTSYNEARKVYTNSLPRKTNYFDIEPDQITNTRTASGKHKRRANAAYGHPLDCNINVEKVIKQDNESPNCTNSKEPINYTYSGEQWAVKRDHWNSDEESMTSDETFLQDDMTPDDEVILQNLKVREKDAIISDIIDIGDRVLIVCPQKPPKYGKKRVLKPFNYTGIVKFKGKLNPDKYDARIYVGLWMDEQVGDTDGTYRGNRVMYTPADQGKFVKVRELDSILNVKTGRYIPVKMLLARHLRKKKKELPNNGRHL